MISPLALSAGFFMIFALSCARPERQNEAPQITQEELAASKIDDKLRRALNKAEIPQDMQQKILSGREDFLKEFYQILDSEPYKSDPYLYVLVDKKHPLEPKDYLPKDLVELSECGAFRIAREGLLLRYPAAVALEEMAEAALIDGVTLVASSAFRSYNYQVEVYGRNVRESGQAAADRESARPGYSQHQLGLVVDFGSITDAFANTKAGKWLTENADAFGWSLSFPDGYEAITGYRWESWHYRFVGKPLAGFIKDRFNGIQQYALQFVNAMASS